MGWPGAPTIPNINDKAFDLHPILTAVPQALSTSSAVMASDRKTAEFARLFDFFERIALQKSSSRTDDNDISVDDIDLPTDLANKLVNLVGTHKHDADTPKKTGTRKRSHTIASTTRTAHEVDSEDDSDESFAKFPLDKKYAFTFKLMVHKLYQMQDWKQKVKDVLERSRIDYRPLAEAEANAAKAEEKVEEEEQKKQDGRVHFTLGNITGGSRRPTVRPRAHSVLALGKCKDAGTLSPILKSPKSPNMKTRASAQAEEVRAIKKRCVGRRKSMNGPLAVEAGRIGGGWVYDAAISSAEASQSKAPPYQGVDASSMHLKAYAVLGVGWPRKVEGRRRVSLGAAGAAGKGPNINNGIARRRALSVMENMAPTVQAQRKRPLEF
ncbi:hypothetical protein H0H87_002627 [Tephrocybe sp. NHM501043]|nr:hypothetical protein H0H87_002627 [Tephrocybe sp. NHM501043]